MLKHLICLIDVVDLYHCNTHIFFNQPLTRGKNRNKMENNANVKMVGMTEDQRTEFITKVSNSATELSEHIDSENNTESLIVIATSKVDEGNQVLSCIVGSHEALVSGLVDFIEKYHSVFKDAVEILAARKMASLITSLGNSLDMPKDEKQ